MRVLLVNPPTATCPTDTLDVPLGLAYLGAALMQNGDDVKAVDMAVTPAPWRELRAIVTEWSPGMACITSVTSTFPAASQAAALIKSLSTETLVVMGGIHVSTASVVELAQQADVDIFVLGEGESTVVEIANLLEVDSGKDWSRVDGLLYRNGDELVRTRSRQPIADLDNLPYPARHLFPLSHYSALRVITSRGCPYRCVFCASSSFWGHTVRFRSPVRVVDEIEHLVREVGCRSVFIVDDTLTLSRTRIAQLCAEIRRRTLDFEWSCLTRVDLADSETLKDLVLSGCRSISFGCESGSDRVLARCGKGIDTNTIRRSVLAAKEAGLLVRTSWIFGLPGDTRETILETIGFIKGLAPDDVAIYTLIPYPGTLIHDNPGKYELRVHSSQWLDYFSGAPVPVATPDGLSPTEVVQLVHFAVSELEAIGYSDPALARSSTRTVSSSFGQVAPFRVSSRGVASSPPRTG